jgi:hypothetical protein
MRQYRTMKGKMVDMDQLLEKNQTMPAVGNVRMNARGDELGPGGKIVKRREEQINAYYENNPSAAVKQPSAKPANTVVQDSVTYSKGKK